MRRVLVLVASTTLVGAMNGRASGAEPSTACSIHLAPDDADEAWRAAVRAVDARVRVLAKETTDCRELVVRIVADGAWVELTTIAGKKAVRHIGGPSELGATVDALLVTIPEEVEAKAEEPVAAAEKLPSPATPIGVEAAPRKTNVLVGLEAGARMAWPGRFVTPVLGGFAGVSLDRWELGIFGRWETSYSSTSKPLPPGVQLTAVVAGIWFGRRVPLSNAVALLVQGHLGGAIVTEEASEAIDSVGGTQGETRVGLAVGFAVPQDAWVRFRPMLGFDLSPTRLRARSAEIDPSLPSPPKWGLTLMLAMESEVL